MASVRGTDFVYSAFMSADASTKQRARDRISLVQEQLLQDLRDDGLVVQMELVKYVGRCHSDNMNLCMELSIHT